MLMGPSGGGRGKTGLAPPLERITRTHIIENELKTNKEKVSPDSSENLVGNHADGKHLVVGKLGEQRQQRQQFCVVHVVKPGGDGHSMVGMEGVGYGRVVDDDGRIDLAPQPAQILCH